jgi:FkbM family methyltransferase
MKNSEKQSMRLLKKFKRLLKKPSIIPLIVSNRLLGFYKLYIAKDQFSIAVSKWLADEGDKKLLSDYSLTSESIVFDLGGYKGDFAFEINHKYGCYVYLYEPVNAFYEHCSNRFKNNPKIKCFNYGLSNASGQALIGNDADGSSVIRNNEINSLSITLRQFKEEFDELKINFIDLLKINVEGSEFLIMPHLIDSGIVGSINNILIQFHDFYPNADRMREEIRIKLSDTHNEKWDYPFVWESWYLR